MHCHDQPTFGAARPLSELHATCRLVGMLSPILHEFRCPKYCAQGKGFQVVRAASQYALEKFSKFHLRFTGTILICVFQDLAATQPSVLQEPRVFLIQCLSLTKLKHMLARYRLLILGVS